MNAAADPLDFGHPHWQPYLWLLGEQAQRLAGLEAGQSLPAEVEAVFEETLRFFAAFAVGMQEAERRTDELAARRAGGIWTEADRRELARLIAWNDELLRQTAERRERYAAILSRLELPPAP